MIQKIRRITTLISLLAFPVMLNYFSPYLPVHGAVMGIVSGSLLLFMVLFMSSLFLHRAFCGWACPASLLQDILSKVNNKLVKKRNWIKFFIWVPWISSIVFLLIKSGKTPVLQPLLLMNSIISVDKPVHYITYYSVILLIVIPGLIVGKRSFCHHICWMAPWMIIGAKIREFFKWASLNLTVDKALCTSCGRCNDACPMSLDVQAMVQANSMINSECILCGECIEICAKKAICYSYGQL
jgi:ferredoxin-type protein NapH